MIRTWLARLIATLAPARHERRLREEIEEHLAGLTARQRARGANDYIAALHARREFGAIEAAKEQFRDQARFRPLENILRDTRFALRQYRKSPTFTLAAVLSLALGIGANAALFSFLNALVLKQMPVPQPDRLMLLNSAGKPVRLTYNQLNGFDRDTTAANGMLGSFPLDVSAAFGNNPSWVPAELVTGDYFRTLQLKPERGRFLTRHDLDDAAGNPACVISHRFWQTDLHGAADVIGRTVFLNTRPYRIIGVTPRAFRGTDLLRPADLLIPATRLPDYMPAFASDPKFDWRTRLSLFSTLVRLKPGATADSTAAELNRLNREYLKARHLDRTDDLQLAPGSGGFQSRAGLTKPVSILLGASLVVLLIACANLATLLLARTSGRAHEFILRLAIGGSPARIFSQVLIESALLAVAGTVAGVAVAFGIERVLLAFLNRAAPATQQLHVGMDSQVLAFVALVAALCVLLFGSGPALQAARSSAVGTSSAGNTRAGLGVRRAFLVAQIALSFVVVLAAGLLTSTLRHLQTIDLGYQPDEIAVLDIRPASGGYAGTAADHYYRRLVERLRGTPGVKAASTALGIGVRDGYTANVEAPEGGRRRKANLFAVGPDYFTVFGARILDGRDFRDTDTPKTESVYVINQHLAAALFPGQSAVGRELLYEGQKLRIIGVVSDFHDQSLRGASADSIYDADGQLLSSSETVYVRCAGACRGLLPTLRSAVQALDPNTPVLAIHTLRTEIEGTFSSSQVLGVLSALFAGLALLLVAAGLYGVLSYTLTRRTREIGIRMAVGALPGDIAALFAREALLLLGIGAGIGIPLALGAVRLLRSQLFGVTPQDPLALAACLVCVAVTIAASAVPPIRRALRIPPQQALRVD